MSGSTPQGPSAPPPCSIGNVGKPHGFRGDFLVFNPLEGIDTARLTEVWIGDAEKTRYPVRHAEYIHKGLKLKLEGLDSDSALRPLRGQTVSVDRSLAPESGAGEFFVADLIGLTVHDEQNQVLGTLCEVESLGKGAPDRWWIEGPAGKFAIPATQHTILAVQPANQLIRVCNTSRFDQYA